MAQIVNFKDIHFETLISQDISAITYYVESGNECFLVDPSVVLTEKIQTILQNRAKTLKYILLTHIPTSHISGHLEYENVEVIVGEGLEGNKTLKSLKTGDSIAVGELVVNFYSTHHFSSESGCYLVKNQKDETLFLFGGADVVYGGGLIPEIGQHAETHFVSTLPVDQSVKVYPAYGASGYYKHIKDQSKTYTLQEIVDGPKINFQVGPYIMSEKRSEYIRNTNIVGPFSFKSTMKSCLNPFGIEQFDQLRTTSMILDIRQEIPDLEKGSITNSYVIPPNGNLALFVYFLVQADKPILIICRKQLRESLLTRLLNIGCSNIIGFNDFTIQEWIEAKKDFYLPLFTSVKDLKIVPEHLIIDCRTPTEWKEENVMEGSKQVYFPNMPEDIEKNKEEYKKYDKIFVYCRLGFRARIGASMFKQAGFDNVYVVPETFKDIKEIVKIVPYQQ